MKGRVETSDLRDLRVLLRRRVDRLQRARHMARIDHRQPTKIRQQRRSHTLRRCVGAAAMNHSMPDCISPEGERTMRVLQSRENSASVSLRQNRSILNGVLARLGDVDDSAGLSDAVNGQSEQWK